MPSSFRIGFDQLFQFGRILVCLTLALTAPLPADPEWSFQRVSTFAVRRNAPDAKETIAEILAINEAGTLVVYTDPDGKALGFVDIEDPKAPKPGRRVLLDGTPTSVAVHKGKALVVVDRGSYQGVLQVIDLETRETIAVRDLGGQPDSIAISPDGLYAVIAIENEKRETAPQPPGWVTIVDLLGHPDEWKLRRVELTGLGATRGETPEPECVDVNADNIAAITLQENNHIVLIDVVAARVIRSFTAGTADLIGVDLIRDKKIQHTGERYNVPREPDGVTWVSAGLVTADEGELIGGTRTFTVFAEDGTILHSSGNLLDQLATESGHYPDERSGKRGVEPEGIDVGIFSGREFLFVGLERASLVAVFEFIEGRPVYRQVLPAGVGPEGILTVPHRDLVLVAGEVDMPRSGIYSTITVYEWKEGKPTYPLIVSGGIGWAGLSGLSADLKKPGILYAVEDKQIRPSSILTLDTNQTPARIVDRLVLTGEDGAPVKYDAEGISVAKDGGFWIVSEGSKTGKPNFLIRVDAAGRVVKRIFLPDRIREQRITQGLEGVAEIREKVYVAFQRPWRDNEEDEIRIGCYDPSSEQWAFARYPLCDKDTGVAGLAVWDQETLAVLERDKKAGPDAKIKRVYAVKIQDFGEAVLRKELLFDLIPAYLATNGLVPKKVEGIARDLSGSLWVVNDNDGTSGTSGETTLLQLRK